MTLCCGNKQRVKNCYSKARRSKEGNSENAQVMKPEFRKQFLNNLKGIKDKSLADEIEFIISAIEEANHIQAIPGIKKLKGYSGFYRIRINDYRIGVKASGTRLPWYASITVQLFTKFSPDINLYARCKRSQIKLGKRRGRCASDED